MSKYSVKRLWNELFGNKVMVVDYAGRVMMKSACGNPNSRYQPTIDHIRPVALGGKDIKANIVICNCTTNEEKADSFPHWKARGQRFHAERTKGISNGYSIVWEERKK